MPPWRRLPVGAEAGPDGATHFRVWAPRRKSVDVELLRETQEFVALTAEGNGYYSGLIDSVGAGTRYRYRLDGGDSFPDPASRFQPDGPHGPSEVIDPSYAWTDAAWRGAVANAPVVYELHVGTFTTGGTWNSAAEELPALAELGISIIEVMPIHDFPGRFGWGYDGVNLYAPTRLYGRPDDFRAFVDRAHSLGISVILDVVYNHLGPDGNFLPQFSESYLTEHHHTDWGAAINFDDAGSAGTREFFVANAGYWISEFHLDGLRLDATQNIYDDGPRHVLADVQRRAREAANGRTIWIVAENEPQDVRLMRPESVGGYGIDSAWNDDWHHSALVALGGRNEAYYSDYLGRATEFVAAARYGYLYQGQWYRWQNNVRGVPGLDLDPKQFVHFLENHDQVANSLRGDRLQRVASAPHLRAMTTLLLLGPQTPMLFQGQEFGSTKNFCYFADHKDALMAVVAKGRADFLGQFQSIAARAPTVTPADPCDPSTFVRSKLDSADRQRHPEVYALHHDLIALRRNDAVFNNPRRGGADGFVLRDDAFGLRYFGADGDDRLLLINLGRPLELTIMPEPLLAPPATGRWHLMFSSEDVRYGGLGTAKYDPSMKGWIIPGGCALVMRPGKDDE